MSVFRNKASLRPEREFMVENARLGGSAGGEIRVSGEAGASYPLRMRPLEPGVRDALSDLWREKCSASDVLQRWLQLLRLVSRRSSSLKHWKEDRTKRDE